MTKLTSKLKVVEDLKLDENITVAELVDRFYLESGFTARKLAMAAKILEKMLRDDKCINMLSFPAAIIATGIRGIFVELIKRGYFDIVITTCGTIDHDLARSFKEYYHGWFEADDKFLHRSNIHRIGNIFVPAESYGLIIEEKTKALLEYLWNEGIRSISTRELLWKLAEVIIDKSPKKENSILWWCWRKKIPIYVPGIVDGAFGFQLFMFYQDHKFNIDLLKDEKELADIVWSSKKIGGLIIGGGISKHHLIWWAQFAGGLRYAIYLTTAPEYDGSLSGARPKEAISWGKIAEEAKHIVVEGDASILLPLIAAYAINRIPERKNKTFF
ncbi:MAG: deoxyhypusine synthase [Crenarchaeota archaeon]|nr:deoxyhypusine synthase [Thermoproteota archaeon]MCR8454221.1 deoxyhypusine synthase [Thermoproteota archaeon]MCR8454733.1 deoxyhypusine synthase [Thermoproteota archaeon]MCR8463407.1 deoxyhypusine synthase [Thermoproteota archaeon]MCR8470244.1 deoxyhypusine synthase [Thermoproteota archaeon]